MERETILGQLCSKYPALSIIREDIGEVAGMIINCYTKGGKLLICGNGGSSSDSEHIAGELMKSFELPRPVGDKLKARLIEISDVRGRELAVKLQQGLPAISLSAHGALSTAIINDIGADMIFAQQVAGYSNKNDILLGISTSGNSQNIIDACITAKALDIKVIGFTGRTGGKLKQYCDLIIMAPGDSTAEIQELHLPIFHAICRIIENHFFKH